MGKQKYFTEEERLKAKKEVQRRWREKHKEQISKHYKENREKILENKIISKESPYSKGFPFIRENESCSFQVQYFLTGSCRWCCFFTF